MRARLSSATTSCGPARSGGSPCTGSCRGPARAALRRLAGFGTTIFAEMSALAARTGAINLGQGFPDTDGPPEVLEAAVERACAAATTSTRPGPGIPELRAAIARTSGASTGSSSTPTARCWSPAGATEAIAAALLALCEPGDEVVTFEPYYDSYAACIALAGRAPPRRSRCGRPSTRSTPTRSPPPSRPAPGWCCSTRRTTRPARSSTRAELELIARHCRERDVLAVTDEVYEHLVFDGREHVPLARCPGWRSARSRSPRPARRSRSRAGRSAGRAARGRSSRAVQTAKQFLTFVSGAPFQPADRARPRPAGRLLRILPRRAAGQARPALRRARGGGPGGVPPPGTYFVTADIRPLGEQRRPRVLPRAARARRRGRGADRRVLRRRGRPADRSSGSRSASATTVIDEAAARLARLQG